MEFFEELLWTAGNPIVVRIQLYRGKKVLHIPKILEVFFCRFAAVPGEILAVFLGKLSMCFMPVFRKKMILGGNTFGIVDRIFKQP